MLLSVPGSRLIMSPLIVIHYSHYLTSVSPFPYTHCQCSQTPQTCPCKFYHTNTRSLVHDSPDVSTVPPSQLERGPCLLGCYVYKIV